jgi:hypothetical protein
VTSRQAALPLCIFLALPTISLADDENLDGLPIIAIHVDRNKIFDTNDPKTSAWFYRWANALHVVSKENFIRSMLLFTEGDPYSASTAAESARILRHLGIINPVEIRAQRVAGGVEVEVETHDRWTLQIGAQAGLSGSRSNFSLDLEENNLAGWGKGAGVAYGRDNERNTWSYRYFDPNVFSTRWRVLLVHAHFSDGSRDEVRVDRPFYSLATPWTWGVEASQENLLEHLYSESDSVVSGSRESENARVWGGARLPGKGNVTRRLVAGWQHRRDLFSDWEWEVDGSPYPTPEDLLVNGPMISYEQIVDRFIVVKGFRAWTVQEDVAFGPNFALTTVFSSPAFGGDHKRWLTAGGGHVARRRGDWLFLGDVWFSGRLEQGEVRNLVTGFQVGAAQLGTRGWQVRLFAENSRNLDLNRQLTLGAEIGLRGWDPDYFDGTGRALLNIQWRRLIKERVLGLFSVGVVVFGDAGATWDPRVGQDTDGIRLDAGVGLLFDLAHLSRSNLLRVDVAMPDDGSGPTITVSTSTIFQLPRKGRYTFKR